MSKPKVLLVDDDPGVRFTLSEVLHEADVEVIEAEDGAAALELFDQNSADLVITDLKMPRLDGMGLLAKLAPRGVKVVMITAHGSEAAAVEAMKLGAYDYFPKPFDVDQVTAVVRRATEAILLKRDNHNLKAALTLSRHAVFRSAAMAQIAVIVERVAPRAVTILIQGESGTGKELIADAIVDASERAGAPYVKFNCAALAPNLAEAELFGHTQGAFTGATAARQGLFRKADKGTLFLDEIAELDLDIQGKLLRALERGEVKPVGVDEVLTVDVRIITATHIDLAQAVEAGRFREDLYYRLNVVPITVPPLRDRPEDLDPLIDHFLKLYAQRFSMERIQLSQSTRAQLLSAEYKGNVRQLANAIERMVALSPGPIINQQASASTPVGLKERVEAYERGLILAELKRAGWNRSEAARQLGLGRVTLLDKMKKYHLSEV